MTWMKNLTGGSKTGTHRKRSNIPDPGPDPRVTIDRRGYTIADLTVRGFRVPGYEGDLIERQQFNFRFHFELDEQPADFVCTGIVAKIDDKGLTALYRQPAPMFQKIVIEYIARRKLLVEARKKRP